MSGFTSTEIIYNRVVSNKEYIRFTNFKGNMLTEIDGIAMIIKEGTLTNK